MIDADVKQLLENLDERLTRVEQFLPTPATKADLAPLATKAEIALIATKEELREEGEKTRRHMDVVAEHLTAQMAMLDESHTRHTERLDGHDARIQAVETTQIDLDVRVGALARKPRRQR